MPRDYRAKVAPLTKYALEDILAQLHTARAEWQKAVTVAERRMDPHSIIYLARIRDCMSEIERLAQDAREGVYNERGET